MCYTTCVHALGLYTLWLWHTDWCWNPLMNLLYQLLIVKLCWLHLKHSTLIKRTCTDQYTHETVELHLCLYLPILASNWAKKYSFWSSYFLTRGCRHNDEIAVHRSGRTSNYTLVNFMMNVLLESLTVISKLTLTLKLYFWAPGTLTPSSSFLLFMHLHLTNSL